MVNVDASQDDFDNFMQNAWAVDPEVQKQLTLASLRPWALRVLFRILHDDELSARLRLDAAKIVVDKTREGEQTGEEQSVDAEVAELVEQLRRRG